MQSTRSKKRYTPYPRPTRYPRYAQARVYRRSSRSDYMSPTYSRYPYSRTFLHKETVRLADIVSATTDNQLSYGFSVDQLGNSSALLSLFDEYRIEKVIWEATPNNMATFSTTNSPPVLYAVVDYTDINTASIGSLLQYSNLKRASISDKISFAFAPAAVGFAANAAGTSLGQEVMKLRWFDAGATGQSISHNGIKATLEGYAGAVTATYTWAVHVTYFVRFRTSK